MSTNANTPHLKVARSDALDVSGRLTKKVDFAVPVTPVIAVLSAKSIKDARSAQNRSVSVVEARELVPWLKAQPASLSYSKIELLKLAAEEPETWHIDPRAADTFRIMQRFERLVARVDAPRASHPSSPSTSTRRPAPRPSSSPSASRSANAHPALPDIVRVWFAAAFIIAILFIVRGVANQPCASPSACLLPAVYMTLKPLLVIVGVAVIGRAAISTARILWSARSRRRPR